MFGSTSRVKQGFAKRFEPDGDGYLFRASIRAPGIRVSAAERDSFVAEFGRSVAVATWVTAALTVLLFVGLALFTATNGASLPDYATFMAIAVCLIPLMAAFLWLWNAPVRALRTRLPSAEGRSRDDARRFALQRMTWGQRGLAALTVPFVLLRVGYRHSLLVGWNRLWLLAAAILLVLLGVQAVRKWRASARRAPGEDGGDPRN